MRQDAGRAVRFPGEREQIRWFASQMALDMIRQYFLVRAAEQDCPINWRHETAVRGEAVRLFVAFDVPEHVLRTIAGNHAAVCASFAASAVVALAGTHVTLKFIGEVAPERAERFKRRSAEVQARAEWRFVRGTGIFSQRATGRGAVGGRGRDRCSAAAEA